MTFKAGVVLIVGAGFAKNAGLPLASEFTKRLLDVGELSERGPSVAQTAFLRRFVDETFNDGAATSDCPSSDHLAQFGSWISGVSASSLG